MRCKRLMLIFLILLVAIPMVVADRVGVIVSFPDGSIHGQCINANEGINGYDLLQKLSLETLWAGPGSFGHQLCKINGVGDDVNGDSCSYAGKYWGFFTAQNNEWQYMPVGMDAGDECWNNDLSSYDGHYCAKEGDLLGFRYGEFGDIPNYYSFDNVCNPLKLKDVKVYVDGKKESGVDEEGGNIEVQPDSEITFKIEVENNYLFDDDLKVEDIEASIVLEDIDDGDDIEEEVYFSDLDVDEDDQDEVEFTIPFFVKDGDYDLELKLTAETSTNIKQEVIVNYDLEVDKEKHNVFISDMRLEKEESCPDENNRLFLEVTNLGRSDEEDITLNVVNNDLSIDFSDMFDLDEGDDKNDVIYEREINFLVPETANVGEHAVIANLAYEEQSSEEVTLLVKDCTEDLPTANKELEESTIQLKAQDQNIIPEPKIKRAVPTTQVYYEKSFLEKNIVPVLLGIFLLVLIVFIILIVVMLRK